MIDINELKKIKADNLKITYLPNEYAQQRRDLRESLGSFLSKLNQEKQFLLGIKNEVDDEKTMKFLEEDLKKLDDFIIQTRGYYLLLNNQAILPKNKVGPARKAMQEALTRANEALK